MLASATAAPAQAALDSWSSIPDPHPETEYYLGLFATETQLFAITVDSVSNTRLFRRGHQAGSSWEELFGPVNPAAVSVAGSADEHVVVSTKGSRFWYSGNGGATWVDRTAGLPSGATMAQTLVDASGWTFVTLLASDDDTNGLGRSSDFGATWDPYVLCSQCIQNPFRQLESDGNPQNLWLSGNSGFFNAEVRVSRDWGETWELVDGLDLYERVPIDLIVDPVHPNRSYVLFPEPFFRFDGTEYLGTTHPPFGTNANAALAAPRWDPGVLYAAGLWSSGLLAIARSGNFGHDDPWETIREGIPEEYPPHPYGYGGRNHLEPHPSPHVPRMYLAYWGMGLFERDFTLEPSDLQGPPTVQAPLVLLAEPIPNPTSGVFGLQLLCDRRTELRIALVDATGRRHFESAATWCQPGRHELGPMLAPTLTSLPSGVYFVRASGSFGRTEKKVTLIR